MTCVYLRLDSLATRKTLLHLFCQDFVSLTIEWRSKHAEFHPSTSSILSNAVLNMAETGWEGDGGLQPSFTAIIK
jgi:hypothetical protein